MKTRSPALAVALAAAACLAKAPPSTVEDTCAVACTSKAPGCTNTQCVRGCNLTIDRIAEHEEDHVLDCVARARVCEDAVWASCATLIGVHADGGPPAPPPPQDDVE